jgi:hypothetical protein
MTGQLRRGQFKHIKLQLPVACKLMQECLLEIASIKEGEDIPAKLNELKFLAEDTLRKVTKT